MTMVLWSVSHAVLVDRAFIHSDLKGAKKENKMFDGNAKQNVFRASSNRNGQKNRKIGIRAPKK